MLIVPQITQASLLFKNDVPSFMYDDTAWTCMVIYYPFSGNPPGSQVQLFGATNLFQMAHDHLQDRFVGRIYRNNGGIQNILLTGDEQGASAMDFSEGSNDDIHDQWNCLAWTYEGSSGTCRIMHINESRAVSFDSNSNPNPINDGIDTGNLFNPSENWGIGDRPNTTTSPFPGAYGMVVIRNHAIDSDDLTEVWAEQRMDAFMGFDNSGSGGNFNGTTGLKLALMPTYGTNVTPANKIPREAGLIYRGLTLGENDTVSRNTRAVQVYAADDVFSSDDNSDDNYFTSEQLMATQRQWRHAGLFDTIDISDMADGTNYGNSGVIDFSTNTQFSKSSYDGSIVPTPNYTTQTAPKSLQLANLERPSGNVFLACWSNSRGMRSNYSVLTRGSGTATDRTWQDNHAGGFQAYLTNNDLLNGTAFQQVSHNGNNFSEAYMFVNNHALEGFNIYTNSGSRASINGTDDENFSAFGTGTSTVSGFSNMRGSGAGVSIDTEYWVYSPGFTSGGGDAEEFVGLPYTQPATYVYYYVAYPGCPNVKIQGGFADKIDLSTNPAGDSGPTLPVDGDSHDNSSYLEETITAANVTWGGSGASLTLDLTFTPEPGKAVYISAGTNAGALGVITAVLINGGGSYTLGFDTQHPILEVSNGDTLRYGPVEVRKLEFSYTGEETTAVLAGKTGRAIGFVETGGGVAGADSKILGIGGWRTDRGGYVVSQFGHGGHGFNDQRILQHEDALLNMLELMNTDILTMHLANQDQASAGDAARTAGAGTLATQMKNAGMEVWFAAEPVHGNGTPEFSDTEHETLREYFRDNAETLGIGYFDVSEDANIYDHYTQIYDFQIGDNSHPSIDGYYDATIAMLTAMSSAAATASSPSGGVSIDVRDEIDGTSLTLYDQFSRPNEVYLGFTSSVDNHTSTVWEIRRENEAAARIRFTTTSSGVTSPRNLAIVTTANVNSMAIKLDKQYNYYIRYKENGGSFTSWTYLDLSGEVRVLGGRHRDKYVETRNSRGSAITNTNPRFSQTRTNRGVSVSRQFEQQARSRRRDRGETS